MREVISRSYAHIALGMEYRRAGLLREAKRELETAVRRQVAHGLYRTGLAGFGPPPSTRDTRRRDIRAHPRHAISR